MKQTVKIFTNYVEGAWSPYDLEQMLGGSEECVVLLSEALQRNGYEVIVYHTKYDHEKGCVVRNEVNYLCRTEAKCNSDDIFVTFKDPNPWIQGAKAKKNIHWSSDVERPWDTTRVDHFVNLTEYHQNRNLFVAPGRSIVIPHGIDVDSLEDSIPDGQNEDSILYCSSPDRGLWQLLQDWPRILKHFPNLKLKITYGFDLYNKVTNSGYNRNIQGGGVSFQDRLTDMIIKLDNVRMFGTLPRSEMEAEYAISRYWILPLNNPDSELFCLNALKTKYCGAMPIVNKVGALQNTVGDYYNYRDFVNGKFELRKGTADVEIMNWDRIVEKYWIPLFEG